MIYIHCIVTSSRVISAEYSSSDYGKTDITEIVMNENVRKFLMMFPTAFFFFFFLGKQMKDEVTILVPNEQWRTANKKVAPQTASGGKYDVVNLFSKHTIC